MSSEVIQQIVEEIEAGVQSRPSSIEFEMAYQARVAVDRIRFAIKHTEQFGPHTDPMRVAALQLLDAMERLEAADRRFQERCRIRKMVGSGKAFGRDSSAQGNGTKSSKQGLNGRGVRDE